MITISLHLFIDDFFTKTNTFFPYIVLNCDVFLSAIFFKIFLKNIQMHKDGKLLMMGKFQLVIIHVYRFILISYDLWYPNFGRYIKKK